MLGARSAAFRQETMMFWLIVLVILFAALHILLLLPTPIAVTGALVVTGVLWAVWKLKWVILAVIGLEEIFGGRDGNA
jgi:hypothetical protein